MSHTRAEKQALLLDFAAENTGSHLRAGGSLAVGCVWLLSNNDPATMRWRRLRESQLWGNLAHTRHPEDR